MEHNKSKAGENSSSRGYKMKKLDSHKNCPSRDAIAGSDLWTDGLICAFEFIRGRKKSISSKPGSRILTKQQTDGEHERLRVPSIGFSESSSPMEDRSKFPSDDYRSSQIQHDIERFEGCHWVPIGWSRLSEIVQTVQADSGWACQEFGVDDEDDFTVADLAAPYWERPAGPIWWCHVSAGHPSVDAWLRNAQWLHPAVSLALRDESRLISDRMKHLLYEVPVRVAGGLLFELLGQSAGNPFVDEDDIPIVLRSWQAQNFLVTVLHIKGPVSSVNVLGITEVQELLSTGGYNIPRTVHEVIAHLTCRLSRWDDRLFRKSIFGVADEVELKFMNRRNHEDLNLFSVILNQEIRKLSRQVIRVKWSLHANRFSYLSMASSIQIVAFLLSVFSLGGEGARQNNSTQLISPGSSLSPISSRSSWPSPSGHFAFGFYKKGAGFAIGIWLVGTDKQTIVWTANRDDLPVTSNAMLRLTSDGKLVLSDRERQENLIVTTGTNSPTDSAASSASMLDSGNFVLYNERRDFIWESFNHPTDTLLGGQILPVGGSLFSSLSENDHSTGRFHLNMQPDGNLVLYSANSENSSADSYWISLTYLQPLQLYLNATGRLVLINSTNWEEINVLDYDESSKTNYKNGTIYRATVDVEGNFRLYSHEYDESTGKFQPSLILWQAVDDPCYVKGFCGLNSYCTFIDNQPNCLCLPGTDYADSDQRTLGCLRNYTEVECNDGKENTSSYHMITMENMVLEDMAYYEAQMLTVKECSRSCLEDCNCGAAVFDSRANVCVKQNLPLRYVRRDPKEYSTAVFKIGNSHNNTNLAIPLNPITKVVTDKKVIEQILVLTLALILFSCVALAVSGFYIFKIRLLRYKRLTEINGDLELADEELTLRAFSFNELRRATNGFKEELGKGSFGAVYKGALNKGKKFIAVKRLEKLVEEGEREFRAEMQAIGRTHHKNLVRLLGYSAEDSKRLLVYEYMSNGSLADLLFRNEWHPAWSARVTIALDVARGLLYLHEECKAPIIHCDIKPQNILMDEFWNAKISDFGLAKLLMPDQTRTFTGIRGTRGYLAPEWQKNTPISVKADVYSYGIVLLEIVCCRRNMDINVRAEEIILSTWVYKCFVGRELHKLVGGEEVDKKTLENMVKVGLWCIQDEPALRPSMKSVVLMLQGITDIAIPPCPTATSM